MRNKRHEFSCRFNLGKRRKVKKFRKVISLIKSIYIKLIAKVGQKGYNKTMKNLRKILFLVLSSCILFLCTACTGTITTKSKTYWAFGTYATLVVSSDFSSQENVQKLNDLDEQIFQTLQTIENSLSLNVASSYVNAFNSANAGESVKVDEITATVLSIAKDMHSFTNGFFNPAFYYSLKAFGFYDGALATTLPSQAELDAYKQIAGAFNKIEILQDESLAGDYYVSKPTDEVAFGGQTLNLKIDLGGIGKGYATDLVGSLLDDFGFVNGYFSVGNSSISVKQSSGGENGEWTLSLAHPRKQGQAYAKTKIKNASLSTSGDYENFFERDGVRYCHIIDVNTGAPVSSDLLTVTVIGGTATFADAVSTALLCMGSERATDFINQNLADYKICMTVKNGESLQLLTNVNQAFELVASDYSIADFTGE